MVEILKKLGEMISKISLSLYLPSKQQEKADIRAPINVTVINNVGALKIGQITFLNKLENIYTEDLIKKLAVKVTYVNGVAASGVPLEFYIKDVYTSTVRKTNDEGIACFENIRFKKEGEYKLCIKCDNDYVYNEVIEVKKNRICMKFLENPSNINSKEILDKISVQVNYISGTKAEKMLVHIGLNIKNVKINGNIEKTTDKNGIVYFDDISLSKTGVYKLKAVCGEEYVYSEPFHVYPPGVNLDFEGCESGSKEETEAFLTALLEKRSRGDIIKYNGEEF